jgi:hypothetical protein
VPIAEAAIARGVGHLIDTPESLAVLKEAAEPDVQPGTKNLRSVRVRRGAPWLRLDVNLRTYAEAERERLRKVA